MNFSSLKHFPSELALLSGSPGVDVTMRRKHDKVIVASRDSCELLWIIGFRLDVEDGDGKELVFLAIGEPKQAFYRL